MDKKRAATGSLGVNRSFLLRKLKGKVAILDESKYGLKCFLLENLKFISQSFSCAPVGTTLSHYKTDSTYFLLVDSLLAHNAS